MRPHRQLATNEQMLHVQPRPRTEASHDKGIQADLVMRSIPILELIAGANVHEGPINEIMGWQLRLELSHLIAWSLPQRHLTRNHWPWQM